MAREVTDKRTGYTVKEQMGVLFSKRPGGSYIDTRMRYAVNSVDEYIDTDSGKYISEARGHSCIFEAVRAANRLNGKKK